MYKLPTTLTDDIHYLDSLINDYKKGTIDGARFKAARVPMGIYEQRSNGTYMVRVRCSGGYITPRQLKRLTAIATTAGVPYLHLTTRQEIQLHYVPLEKMKEVLLALQQEGLGTKGGGGNTIRNIMVDIRAGIDSRQAFDPYPYAADLTTFLIAQNDSFTLPRKLKIAFDISEEVADYALVNDLGFIPRIVEGKRGFRVYLGGSVASRPTKGWLLFNFLPEEDLFRVAIAAKRFFSENGNRKNRHKARIRHIFYKLGEEKTLELFHRYFTETKADSQLTYQPAPETIRIQTPPGTPPTITDQEAFRYWKTAYAIPQQQADLYAITLPIIHGNITADILGRLAAYATPFGEDVIRFTTRQHIQFRHIPEAWLAGWFELFNQLGFATNYPLLTNDIISCTGADTCRLGICFSKGASKAIRNKLIKSGLPLEQFGPARINISGCSNSCAQQVWADLGFSGKVSRNERMYPAYTVYARVNGQQMLGESIGTISARDLPEFCTELFRDYLSQQKEYPLFSHYIEKAGKEKITRLLATYKEIPSFEEDKNYYYDWGSETPFSVTERGKAECSAGLFDMIDIDGGIIEQSIQALEATTDPVQAGRLLYDITFSASRMLLITRGAEPRTTTESFTLFTDLFIHAGLIDKTFLPLIEAAAAKQDLSGRREEVLQLAQAVNALYQTMDDSLQFKGDTLIHQPAPKNTTASHTDKVVKDLRGVGCPMNFVKTKLALTPLPSGALLEVWLDDGPPAENVPGSVRNEGHTILSMEKKHNHWQLIIQKK